VYVTQFLNIRDIPGLYRLVFAILRDFMFSLRCCRWYTCISPEMSAVSTGISLLKLRYFVPPWSSLSSNHMIFDSVWTGK